MNIRIVPFVGMLLGAGIGFYINHLILNYVNSNQIPPDFVAYILRSYNSLYYTRGGPLWLIILGFPIFGAIIGVLMGHKIEKIKKLRSKK